MMRLFTLWNSNAGLVQNARDGNLNRVLDLLQRGLDVNDKNEYGDTALVWASNNGHLEVVRALLKVEGVDVNIKDMDGGTALIYACWKGHLDVARALLSHVAVDVNIRDNNGETALILASEKGHLDIICALLKHNGVDVNIQDNDGKTALIVASDMGHLEVVCSLLKHEGVDVNIKDDDGKTALIVASKEGHLEVVRALVNYEVSNVNIMDKYGYTALDFARMKTKDGVARLLEEHMERVKRLEKEKPEGSDITIQQDRNRLLEAMKTSSADPVELSLDYIERCIKKDHKLGSGAYGDVFLAEDSHLPKKFAVKLIRLTLCDQGTIENIRKSLQRELSVSSLSTDIFTHWE
jgi:ankyrin repeat protein